MAEQFGKLEEGLVQAMRAIDNQVARAMQSAAHLNAMPTVFKSGSPTRRELSMSQLLLSISWAKRR